jgi:hypothetical protein
MSAVPADGDAAGSQSGRADAVAPDVGYPPMPVAVTQPTRERFFGGATTPSPISTGGRGGRTRRASPPRLLIIGVLIVALLAPAAWSYGAALAAPGNDPLGVRSVEWIRQNHGRWLVNDIENFWYSHHKPKKGGAPKGGLTLPAPAGSVPSPGKSPGVPAPPPAVKHLPAPTAIASIVSVPLAGEGQWQPLGQPVQGLPAMYATEVRADAQYSSYLTGLVWMDPNLIKTVLYAGVQLPGGSGWRYQAPVAEADRPNLLAAFNSGFLLKDSLGGYFAEGRMVKPMVDGAATLLIRSDGVATVGKLGRDFGSGATSKWGATLGNRVAVWRSAVGVTANGALVYAGGPALSAPALASVMARAGAVRAMELDINTAWVDFFTYGPAAPGQPPGALTATKLLPNMQAANNRYLTANSRDFVALFRR